MLTELNMRESGWKINNKAKELKLFKTGLNIMDFIKKEKNKLRVLFPGIADPNMKEIFLIIIQKEAAFIYGKTKDDTKDIGRTIKCMAKDSLHGQMAGNMMDSMLMTREMDMENLYGQMEVYTRGLGKMGLNMGKESIWINLKLCVTGYGKTEKELNGLMNLPGPLLYEN